MNQNSDRITYTTFKHDIKLSVIFGICFTHLIAFTSLMLYVLIFILPEEITLAPGRAALAVGTVFIGAFLVAVTVYTGWQFAYYCGILRTDYIFDSDGIHAKGLFKRQFMPWSQIKDFGFTFVMYHRELRRYSRYSKAKVLRKTGRIFKAYFSDTACNTLPNAQKEIKGKRINFYIIFPLSTPTIEHYEGMTWVREFVDLTEEKTGIKPHVPGKIHPFLYPEKIYDITE